MEPLDPELDTGGRGDTQPGARHGGSGGDAAAVTKPEERQDKQQSL
jgi:hypothetical protein